MDKSTATIALAVSLTSVAASQLLFKMSFAHIERGMTAGQSYLTIALRALADPLLCLAVLFVLVGAFCWYFAMIRLPLTLMLPMSGIIAPIVSLGAWLALGESMTMAKAAAIMLISIGVVWLGWLNS